MLKNNAKIQNNSDSNSAFKLNSNPNSKCGFKIATRSNLNARPQNANSKLKQIQIPNKIRSNLRLHSARTTNLKRRPRDVFEAERIRRSLPLCTRNPRPSEQPMPTLNPRTLRDCGQRQLPQLEKQPPPESPSPDPTADSNAQPLNPSRL